MGRSSDIGSIPLRPAVHHILLALVGRERHGLGIAEQIEKASEGTVELGPGTLYRSLAEMGEAGLVEAVPAPAPGADPRRKYYRLTERGRDLLAEETRRLDRLVEAARARGVLAEER